MELFENKNITSNNNQQALLIYIDMYGKKDNGKEEFIELATSTGIIVFKTLVVKVSNIKSAYFLGTGKVQEIEKIISDNKLKLVIFSIELSPSQERNLEKYFKSQVLDRVALILDIFALRAKSFEGKLQVELAQLKHLSTRLIKGWSHLERQKGGIGLRGPGETQLETDRRLIGHRIKRLNKQLEKVAQRRALGRKLRQKNNLPIITLAGYTNAGKSTLFNQLTNSKVYANNKLFATLDTTIRQTILPSSGKVAIIDTVGFIDNLPTDLIQAFKSTLEENVNANIILHIVDSTDNARFDKINQVEDILSDIGAKNITKIIIMNKIDMLDNFKPRIDRDKNGDIYRVWISSKNNNGIELLYQSLSERLNDIISTQTIRLELFVSYIRNQIYNVGYIKNEKVDNLGAWILEISVTKHYLKKLLNIKGVELWPNN